MDEARHSLPEHLDELRKRIIYCLVYFAVFSSVSWNYAPAIMKYISSPVSKLVFLHPVEAFSTYIRVCFWSGFYLTVPVIIYNIWKFIESGLTEEERKCSAYFLPFVYLLFMLGSMFSFFVIIPFAVAFLVGFGSSFAEPMLSVGEYISFVGYMVLAFGLAFELPVIILFLAKLKILPVGSLTKYRKHAIAGIFIASAVVTPTPDIFNQMLLVFPLIFLYELGTMLSRFVK